MTVLHVPSSQMALAHYNMRDFSDGGRGKTCQMERPEDFRTLSEVLTQSCSQMALAHYTMRDFSDGAAFARRGNIFKRLKDSHLQAKAWNLAVTVLCVADSFDRPSASAFTRL